jgi:hypothetical protein
MPKAAKPEDAKSPARYAWPTWMMASVLLIVVAVIGCAFYSGSSVSKMSIAGLFDIGFSDPQKPAGQAIPIASRDFMLGQWQLQIDPLGGNLQTGSSETYNDDGTFSGSETEFNGGQGQQFPVSGTWKFDKLSDHEFLLTAWYANGGYFQGRFRIFDENHIQNEDQNYIATRIP